MPPERWAHPEVAPNIQQQRICQFRRMWSCSMSGRWIYAFALDAASADGWPQQRPKLCSDVPAFVTLPTRGDEKQFLVHCWPFACHWCWLALVATPIADLDSFSGIGCIGGPWSLRKPEHRKNLQKQKFANFVDYGPKTVAIVEDNEDGFFDFLALNKKVSYSDWIPPSGKPSLDALMILQFPRDAQKQFVG